MSSATENSPESSLRAAIFHYFQWASSTTSTAAASTGAEAAAAAAAPPGTDENEKDKGRENTKDDPPSPPNPKGSKVLAALLEEFPEIATFKAPLVPVPELKLRFEGYWFEVSRRMYLENQVAFLQLQRQDPPFAAAPSLSPAMAQPAAASSNAASPKRKHPPSSEAKSTTPATKRKDPPKIANANPKRQKPTKVSPEEPAAVAASANPERQKPTKVKPTKVKPKKASSTEPAAVAESANPEGQKPTKVKPKKVKPKKASSTEPAAVAESANPERQKPTKVKPKKGKPKKGKPTKASSVEPAAVAEGGNPVRTAASQPPHNQKQPAMQTPAAKAASGKPKSEVKRESVSWEERYEQLVKFHKENGHSRVPDRGAYYRENPGLKRWVADQRALYELDPTLEPERVAKLNEINFEWVAQVRTKNWEERFEELKEFQREHGHTRVPRSYKQNIALGEWVHSQRTRYRKKNPILMKSDRLPKLQAIGFEFILVSGQTKSWDERFEQLVEFHRTHGHTHVPIPKPKTSAEKNDNGGLARAKRQNHEDEFTFACWVKLQKAAYLKYKNGDRSDLTDLRFTQLEDIGFTKEPVQTTTEIKQKGGIGHHRRDDNLWNLRMEELSDYKKHHGDCNVPSRFPENKPLADWVKAQRKYYQLWQAGKQSCLTEERRQVLESIEFQWVIRPSVRKEMEEKEDEENGDIEDVLDLYGI